MDSPQSWNRFGYVGNNPVNFNDPTGHMQENDDDGGCYPCTQLPSPIPDPDTDTDGLDDDLLFEPTWEEIIEPGDEPYIAYAIEGKNYWAVCSEYKYGHNCSSSITYRLNGQEAYALLYLLERNLAPGSFSSVAGKDGLYIAISELLSKQIPGLGNVTSLADWYEWTEHNTIHGAFETLGSHTLKNMEVTGNSGIVPAVNISFTTGLHNIRPMTPFETAMTPGGGGIYRGSYAGTVMTVTNVDNSAISTSSYLGEFSSNISEILRLVSQLAAER